MLMVAKRDQPETTEAIRAKPRMLVTVRPICPVHDVPMFCNGSPAAVRYYYCPIEGCEESDKVAKPNPSSSAQEPTS